ncbi:ATP-binding protein [Pontibacter sp. Tf4]|uniref:AlbA family DNA-binding domain-containing protein n=1 Tax=Pontibacter sp. Tf4 TaxID=2761620 RepID=UPI001629293C|nr:ATP-binding protein [Pontibacter sp. Tf4]MBB6609601.1 ATP-binding protein [Pontibacter sp. Tf4]
MMFGQPTYKGISPRAKALLAKEENLDVDFKSEVKLDSEDLVAFANSDTGGTLLLGIEELRDAKSRQYTNIRGCTINDENKQKINAKAYSCIPHIEISIHAENISGIPFYRIEIPSGKSKPYCTQSGIYKIRKDGRNKALLPDELFHIFLEKESDNFLSNFKRATVELREELNEQNNALMNSMWETAVETETNIEKAVSNIGDMLNDVYAGVESAEANIQEFYREMSESTHKLKEDIEINYDVKDKLATVDKNIINLAWKLNSILDHLNIEDPEITYAREQFQGILWASKRIFKEHKIASEETFLEEIYERAPRIIRENYKLEDIINWYNTPTQL